MFYFDKHDPLVLFTDIREVHDTLCDGRKLDVAPDMIADCTNLPFLDESFHMVVFDPPHLAKVGQNSWLCKKYGKLPDNWQQFINDSIHEGMRVLKPYGTLIFKWNEQQIKVSDILKAITDYRPIFGHRTTIKNQTIWMAFMKIPKEESSMKQYDPKIEYNLGDTFLYGSSSIIVVEDIHNNGCKDCFFNHNIRNGTRPCIYCGDKHIKFLEIP